ncbi:MAG: TIGR04063 family PEP-CTERM/XrtA system glycosyltransferase [Motiliproteus sp.]
MKILHVLDHSIPLHSGYTFRTRAILNNQRLQGFETCHVTSPKQGSFDADQETVDGLKFYRSPTVKSPWKSLPILNQLAIIPILKQRILGVIESEQPDIIHAHSPALNGVAAYQAAKLTGLPLVYEVRAFWEDAAVNLGTCRKGGLRYRLTRAMESYVLKNADAVTCICQGLKDDIIERGVAPERITTIPNAVDLNQFNQLTEKSQPLLDQYQLQDKQVIGFIGSFYEYEGLDILIQAFEKLTTKLPDLRLLLVGGGPQEASLQQLVHTLGLQDRIIFTGRVPHQQVSDYYSLVDALVYPRKSMRLTELVTPLKPMEAMAQAKLVLASDVGGHRELITPGDNGYLFSADSPDALAQAVSTLFDNPDQHQQVISSGLSFVHTERNWANSVSRYQSIYHALKPDHAPEAV